MDVVDDVRAHTRDQGGGVVSASVRQEEAVGILSL